MMYFNRSIAVDCPALDISDATTVTGDPNFDEVTTLACPEGYDFHLEKYKTYRNIDLTCRMGAWYIGDKSSTIPECRGMMNVIYLAFEDLTLSAYNAPRNISGEHKVAGLSVRPSVRPSVPNTCPAHYFVI